MKKLILILLLLFPLLLKSQSFDFSDIKREQFSVFPNTDTTRLNGTIQINTFEDFKNFYTKLLIVKTNETYKLVYLNKNVINNFYLKRKAMFHEYSSNNEEYMLWDYPNNTFILFIRTKYNLCVINKTFNNGK